MMKTSFVSSKKATSNNDLGLENILEYEVVSILRQLKLMKYEKNFAKEGVIYKDLSNLTREDLERLIPDPIPRRRLELFIKSNFLQKRNGEGWEIPSSIIHEDKEEKVLGVGNFGRIKTGEIDVGAGRMTVALKEIVVDGLLVRKQDVVNEVRIMSECHHENILKTYGCFFSNNDKLATICLEYLPEGNIWQFRNENKLSPMQAVNYLVEIATGLTYLHSKNMCHRDLKPENILIHENRRNLKICDFGCAKISKKVGGTFIGTATYMCPEMYFDSYPKPYDPRKIDVYAFGILMYEFLADERAFSGLMKKYGNNVMGMLREIHVFGERGTPLRPDTSHENISRHEEFMEGKIITLMEHCYEALPDDRPDMEDVLEELVLIKKSMEGILLLDKKPIGEIKLEDEDEGEDD